MILLLDMCILSTQNEIHGVCKNIYMKFVHHNEYIREVAANLIRIHFHLYENVIDCDKLSFHFMCFCCCQRRGKTNSICKSTVWCELNFRKQLSSCCCCRVLELQKFFSLFNSTGYLRRLMEFNYLTCTH